MVFQCPHGRLNYGFMLLDRDLAYFILILIFAIDIEYYFIFQYVVIQYCYATSFPFYA